MTEGTHCDRDLVISYYFGASACEFTLALEVQSLQNFIHLATSYTFFPLCYLT